MLMLWWWGRHVKWQYCCWTGVLAPQSWLDSLHFQVDIITDFTDIYPPYFCIIILSASTAYSCAAAVALIRNIKSIAYGEINSVHFQCTVYVCTTSRFRLQLLLTVTALPCRLESMLCLGLCKQRPLVQHLLYRHYAWQITKADWKRERGKREDQISAMRLKSAPQVCLGCETIGWQKPQVQQLALPIPLQYPTQHALCIFSPQRE